MLVLTRKKEECLIIGNNIEITILGISKESVKIGISAPREVSVYRKEIYDSICMENEAASHPEKTDLRLLQRLFSSRT